MGKAWKKEFKYITYTDIEDDANRRVNQLFREDKHIDDDAYNKEHLGKNIQVRMTEDGRGWGVFAKRDFKRGWLILEYIGMIKLFETRPVSLYTMHLEDKLYVDATDMGNEARFVNHRCENENAHVTRKWCNRQPALFIYAIRDIQKGEEICMDYEFQIPFDGLGIPCLCNQEGCRGEIGHRAPKRKESGTVWRCPHDDKCKDKSWKHHRDFRAHLNSHVGLTPHHCPYCPREYVSLSNMIRHRNGCSNAPADALGAKHECYRCSKAFPGRVDSKVRHETYACAFTNKLRRPKNKKK